MDAEDSLIYLPKDNAEMEQFLIQEKDRLFFYIANKIRRAVVRNEDSIEVFGFVSTEYYVILYKTQFLPVINRIFNYFLEKEKYEHLSEIKQIQDKLERYTDLVKTKI